MGDTCRVDAAGREITGDDYLPRRLMGEYLQWFYTTLVASAPAKVEIVHHHTAAVNIVSRGERERVLLANGEYLDVDHVILTSGHTDNVEPEASPALIPRPYPVDRYTKAIPRGATVAVEGMGLVATDVVIALTRRKRRLVRRDRRPAALCRLRGRTDASALLPKRVPLLLKGGGDR